MPAPVELLQGTLDFLILKTLTWGPMHGFEISRWIKRTTEDALEVEEGALYPALHRMERKGWLEAEWAMTEQSRRAKYYRLTRAGRERLRAQDTEWRRYVAVVGKIIAAAKA
ncbi:MAG: PadR family transcriptional regulator [Gemmatimonadetes bacterium]|nr:PadR family transcriptional regulator [Gemmatimonadota bacterium]